MFCPKCGSMMLPKDGKYACMNKDCEYEEEVRKTETFTTKEVNKEVAAVGGEEMAVLPKTRILCPKCGNTEAYFELRQTRSADEPETRIYRCTKCNYNWREY